MIRVEDGAFLIHSILLRDRVSDRQVGLAQSKSLRSLPERHLLIFKFLLHLAPSCVLLVTFLANQLSCLNASFVLLLQHIDFDVVVSFEEADFFLKSHHSLFLVFNVFLALHIQFDFQIFVFLLEQFKDTFFMLELVLKAFSDLFKFLNIILHVLKEGLLLLLLLLLFGYLLGFLHSNVLLELVK